MQVWGWAGEGGERPSSPLSSTSIYLFFYNFSINLSIYLVYLTWLIAFSLSVRLSIMVIFTCVVSICLILIYFCLTSNSLIYIFPYSSYLLVSQSDCLSIIVFTIIFPYLSAYIFHVYLSSCLIFEFANPRHLYALFIYKISFYKPFFLILYLSIHFRRFYLSSYPSFFDWFFFIFSTSIDTLAIIYLLVSPSNWKM